MEEVGGVTTYEKTLPDTAMGINRISKVDFDKYGPSRGPNTSMTSDEQDWYATDTGNVIGLIARDKVDNDWLWVGFGKDQNGKFRAIKVEISIDNQQDATSQLIDYMDSVEKSGQQVFPQ